jgi:hypothetical protein
MKYITRKRILKFSSARTSRSWLKKIKFKKYDNLSLYKFLKIFGHNISEDEIGSRQWCFVQFYFGHLSRHHFFVHPHPLHLRLFSLYYNGYNHGFCERSRTSVYV